MVLRPAEGRGQSVKLEIRLGIEAESLQLKVRLDVETDSFPPEAFQRDEMERFVHALNPDARLISFESREVQIIPDALKAGEICPECRRAYDPDLAAAPYDYDEDSCLTCGMIFTWEAPAPPARDPDAAADLSSWDYRALKLISENPGTLTEGDALGIIYLFPDLEGRGLIVLDAAGQPFLTPKGINSLREHNPAKDSNPPLELADSQIPGLPLLRHVPAPVQITPTHRAPSRSLPHCETCHGTGLAEYAPNGDKLPRPVRCWAFDCPVNDREISPAPYDSPFAHNEGCPKRWGGAACLCNSLDADDAQE